jgi:hypothetical protein
MDTESLLLSVNVQKVRYVVVGATPFPVHGNARATLDTDIFSPRSCAQTALLQRVENVFGTEPTTCGGGPSKPSLRPGSQEDLTPFRQGKALGFLR